MLHFQENKECSSIVTKKREGNERQDISLQSIPKKKSILKSQPMQTSLLKSRETSYNAISTPDTSDAENLHVSALTKRKRKSKLENIDNRVEEAIIQELQKTRPINELPHTKPDKIETFVKYVEACLRGMLPDTSKRIINRISQILMEEDL
ncbi:uncharacterized protein LOC105192933 isoform X2 [Solenopsis invicta]|uniref:uncharacterized protein LOC105192933 isoform X2 n=1 Tax=Solenopsis invicta TaxID=13686 RepID=UPI000595868A|nr:uncharacterized protein LOC105192933 isoform X2 [Solenopsis invicta]